MVAELGHKPIVFFFFWKPSVEHLCWATGDRSVLFEESVDAVYTAVIHFVFSEATKHHHILRSDANPEKLQIT